MGFEGNVSTTAARFMTAFADLSNKLQHVTLAVGLTVTVYLIWMFWRFRVRRILRPQEPPELPYWIPFVGHAISMFYNQEALLKHGREYFQGQPFTLTVVGQTIYIQTSLEDIAATYRNSTTISFYDSVREIMASWGLSKDGLAKMWDVAREGPIPNPHGKSFGALSHDIRRSQLEAGQGLKDITDSFERRLDPYVSRSGIPPASIVNCGAQGVQVVSLLRFCQYSMIPAGTDAFFGTKLRTMCPAIDEKFITFDRNAWQLLFQLPPSMAKEMHAAKTVVTEALGAYTEAPTSEKEDAAWMIRILDSEMESMAFSTADKAIIHFMMYWLINVNSYKLSFWMFAFILSSPSITKDIREELDSFTPESPDLADPTMTHLLQSCPTLNAVFDEALRITVSAASTRNVLSDTVLNNRLYKAGAKILIPYRQLHFVEGTFGPAPYSFDHTRFLHKNGALGRSTQFKPFGGGSTLCTGRFIARREVILIVARMIGRFDMELCEDQAWPEMDMLKPGLGVMEPKEGQDLKIRLHERKR